MPDESSEGYGVEDVPDPPVRSYRGSIILFWETMEALREIADSLGPVLVDLDGYDRIGQELAEELPPEDRASFLEHWEKSKDSRTHRSSGDTDELRDSKDVEQEPEEENSDSQSFEEVIDRIAETDDPRALAALRAIARIIRRAPRAYFAYQSLLAMAVGSFEVLLGQVWSALFRDRPAMLDDQEKRFSLADLAEFETMEDALDVAIEHRVDSLLFKGLHDWKQWFSQHEITDFEEYAMSWPAVQEVIQRRHVVVHNGGRVSRRYLEAIPPIDDPPELHERLWTNAEYLHDAIDELIILGAIIAGATWRKTQPDESDEIATALLVDIAYPLLVGERWRAAAHMSRVTREIAKDGYTYWALQCNEWHAKKMLSGVEAIQDEVSEWDTSALSNVFLLVKDCLLDDVDTAFEKLERLLESGELKEKDLREWPVLAPLRDDPRYLLMGETEGQTDQDDEGKET